jgi:hypothetical protein
LMRLARVFSHHESRHFEVYVNDEILVPDELIPCGDQYRQRMMNESISPQIRADMETDMALLRRSMLSDDSVCRKNRDSMMAGYYSIRALRARVYPDAPPMPREPWEAIPPERIVELAKAAVRVELRAGWLSGVYRVVVDVPNEPTATQLMLHETTRDAEAQEVAESMRAVLTAHMLKVIGGDA